MRILLVGGGSIGHIAPAVAVLRALQADDPNTKALFVCSDRADDATFLTKEGIVFEQLPLLRRNLLLPLRWMAASRRARALLETFHPDVIFSKGGSVSVPIALAAHRAGIPIVLHESDVVTGHANRLVTRYAKVICHGFPVETDDDRHLYTGNPVRPDVLHGVPEKGLRLTGFSGKRPVLMIIGGSQGAQALNTIIRQHLDALLEFTDIIHLTGRGKEGEKTERPGYYQRAFAHDDLPHFLAITNLAISRAGAGSIAELATCGIPSILVPLRGLAQDHQMKNAQIAARTGGCIIVEQKELEKSIVSTVRNLLHDSKQREHMSHAIHRLAVPDAAHHIAQIVTDFGRRSRISI